MGWSHRDALLLSSSLWIGREVGVWNVHSKALESKARSRDGTRSWVSCGSLLLPSGAHGATAWPVPSIVLPCVCQSSSESFWIWAYQRAPLAATKASSDVPTFIPREIIHEYMIRITVFRLPCLLWAMFPFKVSVHKMMPFIGRHRFDLGKKCILKAQITYSTLFSLLYFNYFQL